MCWLIGRRRERRAHSPFLLLGVDQHQTSAQPISRCIDRSNREETHRTRSGVVTLLARLTKQELNCRACGFLDLHIPPSLQSLAQETPSKAVRRPATQGWRQWLCDAHHGCSKRPPIDPTLHASPAHRYMRAGASPEPPGGPIPRGPAGFEGNGALWSIVAPRSVCIEGRTTTSDDAGPGGPGSSIILVSAASGRGSGRIAHGVALLLFIGAALCRVEPSCVGGRRVGGQGSQQEPRRAPRAMVPLGRAGLG